MNAKRSPSSPLWQNTSFWIVVSAVAAFALFLSTLQTDVNGSRHPYATDVGEIQNALPRWGTLHQTGYPLYTLTGSLFVTALRAIGISPAAGSSLFSAVWGAVTIGLLMVLAQALGAPGASAALGALVTALSTSVWVDASLAEVHTLTIAFTVATLLLAVRFGRTGARCDLLLLTLAFSQGIVHQRVVLFLAPAVAVLVAPRVRSLWRGLLPALALAALAPLTYLYLPLRAWQGADWVFGSPGAWDGFWTMVLDNKAERIVRWPTGIDEWLVRAERALDLLADDLPLPLLVIGLAGLLLLALDGRQREALALTLAWLPYVLLCLVIWENRVSDALLAAKLPVVVLSGVGLALAAGRLGDWHRWAGMGATVTLVGAFIVLLFRHRPIVLAITRDPGAEAVIAAAEQVTPSADNRPTTFMALWGVDYWALTYAQAFRGQLPGLNLVDHNADFQSVVDRGDRLLTLSKTLYRRPLSWWDGCLGRAYLSSVAPGVIEISTAPPVSAADAPPGPGLDLGNGLRVWSAELSPNEREQLVLTVYWQAEAPPTTDYSVAVHMVARDPPQEPADILAQADRLHPVDGWYPTSRWSAGEIVCDHYLIEAPDGTQPVALRIALYQVDPAGGFVNSPWLSLPLSSAP